jgi:chromosome segregation ATPase
MKSSFNRYATKFLYHIAKANAEIKSGKQHSSQQDSNKKKASSTSIHDFQSLLDAVQKLKQDVNTTIKNYEQYQRYDAQLLKTEHDEINDLKEREQDVEAHTRTNDMLIEDAAQQLENLSGQVSELQRNVHTYQERPKEPPSPKQHPVSSTPKEEPKKAHNELSFEHMQRLQEIMHVEEALHRLEQKYEDAKHSEHYSQEKRMRIKERIEQFRTKIKKLKEKNKIFE